MADDFNPILVVDSRLDTSPAIDYAVFQSGQSVTVQKFPSQSQSAQQLNFNVQTPSETAVMDRNVLLQATVQFSLKVTTGANAAYAAFDGLLAYGQTCSLGNWPLNNLCQTMQIQINANTFSISMVDILPLLQRCYDHEDLMKYGSFTPYLPDTFGEESYNSQNDFISNPLAGSQNMNLNRVRGRGSYVLDGLSSWNWSQWSDASYNSVALGNKTIVPAFYQGPVVSASNINSDVSATPYAANTEYTLYGQVTITECLLLPPFLSYGGKEEAGMYGIQNMSITMNQTQNGNRFWRTDNTAVVDKQSRNAVANVNCTINAYVEPQLIITFLSAKPSQLLAPKCSTPYLEFPRFINTAPAPAIQALTDYGPRHNPRNPVTFRISSNSIQLNQVPDRLVLFCRIPVAQQTTAMPDFFFPVNNVTIQWNNVSGICSTWTPQNLYQATKRNGINLDYLDFKGMSAIPPTASAGGYGAYQNRAFDTVLGCGSLVVLDFGHDIPIAEEYLAPGSTGSYNIQVTAEFNNYRNIPVPGGQVEMVMITVNSGVVINSAGTTSVYTGLLSKQMVIDLAESSPEPLHEMDLDRIMGKGIFDKARSGLRKVGKFLAKPLAAAANYAVSHPAEAANLAKNVLGMVGHGESGGKRVKGMGESGGAGTRVTNRARLADRLL